MVNEFFFKNVSADSVGIAAANRERVIKPETRVLTYTVPEKDGAVLYDSGVFEPFELNVTIIMRELASRTMREVARDVGYFLQGTGSLVFADEPDKEYIATAIQQVDVRELVELGKSEIVFWCQPFARSIAYKQKEDIGAELPSDEAVTVEGTQKTPCIINITARTQLNNLRIVYTY